MAVGKSTLARALAYLKISGGKRGLHINTRMAMHPFENFEEYEVDYGSGEPLKLHRLVLNEAGLELAKASKLFKAHEALLALGFKYDPARRPKPGFIRYVRFSEAREKVVSAFISGDHPYYQPEEVPEGKGPWEHVPLEF